MYIYLHFEGHSLITINIRPNIEGSAQLLDSGDWILQSTLLNKDYFMASQPTPPNLPPQK